MELIKIETHKEHLNLFWYSYTYQGIECKLFVDKSNTETYDCTWIIQAPEGKYYSQNRISSDFFNEPNCIEVCTKATIEKCKQDGGFK